MIPTRKSIAQAREREMESDRQVSASPDCICGKPFEHHEFEGEIFSSPFGCRESGCKGYCPISRKVDAA
jgi:hypothetical protein